MRKNDLFLYVSAAVLIVEVCFLAGIAMIKSHANTEPPAVIVQTVPETTAVPVPETTAAQPPEIIFSPAVEPRTEAAVVETTAAIEETEAEVIEAPALESLGAYTTTFYCDCKKCNGKWGPIDGLGNPLVWGTVAVDKKVIPLGTELMIEGYPDTIFTARDTGSGVNGKHIDIYVPVSHAEALQMGQGANKQVWRVIR